jgi:hypothetical protein
MRGAILVVNRGRQFCCFVTAHAGNHNEIIIIIALMVHAPRVSIVSYPFQLFSHYNSITTTF